MTALVALMALLQLADVYTTRRFLKHGKRELNPLIRAGLERFGFWPTMAAKLALAAVCTAVLAWLGLAWLLAALCTIYAAVVVNNWRISQRSN